MAADWSEKDDHELLSLIRDGNRQGFSVLVERHLDRFYRIVVNQCLDWQKKKRPVELDEEISLADSRDSLDSAMIRMQEQKILEKEIAALPERQRTALNLCFDEGLSNQEAAEVMGVGLKALQSLIMRAKTTLRDRMNACL
jgi:RNA polymerase sigma-70 factor (ECF subfamily)